MFGLMPYERRSNIGYYNPFKELEEFEKRLFSNQSVTPQFRTDIRDTEKEYILKLTCPVLIKRIFPSASKTDI